jgi:hypothetical protein
MHFRPPDVNLAVTPACSAELSMRLKRAIAILAIVAAPLMAQAQQQKAVPKPTKADAERVVKIVSADKAKAALYCQIGDLGDQISQAVQKKDEKKADALADQADALGAKIGPEYVALMNGFDELDPNSKVSQDIGTVLEALDKLCDKK